MVALTDSLEVGGGGAVADLDHWLLARSSGDSPTLRVEIGARPRPAVLGWTRYTRSMPTSATTLAPARSPASTIRRRISSRCGYRDAWTTTYSTPSARSRSTAGADGKVESTRARSS